MKEFSFQALGTHWSILVDVPELQKKDTDHLLESVAQFEQRFSRFFGTSEVNQFRESPAGSYEISSEFAKLLRSADTLRSLTGGVYNPAIGMLMEHVGYDQTYRMTENDKVATYQIPDWSFSETTLTISGSVVFDFGGIGKGYCIDLVASFLQERGYQYFLVEGGGDMYATTKADGRSFVVALEWPGKEGVAYGSIELSHQGLAVSDGFKRRWKNWHHIIDSQTKKPITQIMGATAVAKSAFAADCLTSGLFLSSKEKYQKLAESFEGEFVVFTESGAIQVSGDWPGKLFE